MDFFIQFVISFGSYLIIAYLLYSILGGKRTIPIVALTVILFSTVFEFLKSIGGGIDPKVLLLYFMIRVLPVIFAFYAFMVITGGLPFFKIRLKSKKIKGISSNIQTRKFSNQIAFYSILGALVFGVLIYLYVDGYMKYVMLSILTLALFGSIYVIISNQRIASEDVILMIGKNREYMYRYEIPKEKQKVYVTDFFTHENYIVDPVGVAILKKPDRKIEKHYLYWIATGDTIDMSDSKLIQIDRLPYVSYLEQYEKYHFRVLTFLVSSDDQVALIRNKIIK